MKFFKVRVLNFNVADKIGDVFPDDCQVEFKNPLPITDAGGEQFRHQGKAVLSRESHGIDADLEIDEGTPCHVLIEQIRKTGVPLKLYPAVNGAVVERDGRGIKSCMILSIDLCAAGNSDPTIPPLTLTEEPVSQG